MRDFTPYPFPLPHFLLSRLIMGEEGKDVLPLPMHSHESYDPPTQSNQMHDRYSISCVRKHNPLYLSFIYRRSDSICCGAELACASTEVAACWMIWFFVRLTTSAATLVSRIWLSEADRFSTPTPR